MNPVLLVLTDMINLDSWIQLALALRPQDAPDIQVRALVQVAEGQSLSEGATAARQWRDLLDPLVQAHEAISDDVRVIVEFQPMTQVLDELQQEAYDLLLVQWAGPNALTAGVNTEMILQQAACDVALLHGNGWEAAGPVLLSLRGGPNITLGVRLAKALAGQQSITLFHASDGPFDTPDLDVVMRAEPKINRTITAMTELAKGILRESQGHKALVLGAGFRKPEANTPSPLSTIQAVRAQTSLPMALVRARRPEQAGFHAPQVLRSQDRDLSARVDRWFAENTFHSQEFADLATLMKWKEKQGVTISVGLPALNEEETIEQVICTLKEALMDAVPLVDEFVLIDSNSTDQTVPIAQANGIPVHKHPDILPELGSVAGKGEALWKSLMVLKGDIIAWVDTDITNIHPRFVYGLIGPLLKHPHLHYVKGFYQRPIQVDDTLQAFGGGRVTELVARPMFNLFYPELSGIIQPLSGEYAGRRRALEQLSFFSGYGVETGLLIDLLESFGLGAIAQSDLEVRVHHNQPLISLSKMSFAILQVFIARLEGKAGAQILDAANRSMKLIVQEPERFGLEVEAIGDVERPPMIALPEYREREFASVK
jgi:glucosyl-3-phosphoglycerate synthase